MTTKTDALVIGQEYRNGHGQRVNIQSHTRRNKGWVVSIQGDWYEQATGMFLWFVPNSLRHVFFSDTEYVTRSEPGQGKNINF